MDLKSLNDIIVNSGLAILIILCMLVIFIPWLKKKLDKDVENDNKLEETVQQQYFILIEDTKKALQDSQETNKSITKTMEEVNITNKELSATNKELAITNRKLVESYGQKMSDLEENMKGVQEGIQEINKKVDTIIE
ncbi:MAG: hypothetical protein ACLTDM_07370 [Clostridium butyricum]